MIQCSGKLIKYIMGDVPFDMACDLYDWPYAVQENNGIWYECKKCEKIHYFDSNKFNYKEKNK